ncbi:IclR family transcriptional regulator [Marinovum sp. 2_MG-2023]|uniref:IclR family transcriptional regulator n=1 Tax=unclassified Marinovum TaxID=2647166 RepID=UPI0026E30A19|nr:MULTISPECIES: IclR family transcriptional regulator [unclassified Marinovum]MDO6732595.1 IclR family transcriptional regulator [Marinovum sp. 2_MG-2023]MDO6782088.1 IclR family transcriptional regulator [Marinovum sp. 1_MG-2023]
MTQPRKPVRSVLRAAAVLKAIGAGAKGPSAIAAELEISKGTVFDLLKTLETVGFVRQDESSEKYLLGPALMRLAMNGSNQLNVVQICAPHLQRLSDEIGEVAHLGQRDGYNTIYLYRAASERANRLLNLNSLIGAHSPLHCTSMGKIFLAQLSDQEFAEFLTRDHTQFTAFTLCDAESLLAERDRVRESGFATNIGEFEEGVSSVAVPLRFATGSITHGINIAMPTIRMPEALIPKLAEKLHQTAAEIEKDFGLK